jgi:hypothetical protein
MFVSGFVVVVVGRVLLIVDDKIDGWATRHVE